MKIRKTNSQILNFSYSAKHLLLKVILLLHFDFPAKLGGQKVCLMLFSSGNMMNLISSFLWIPLFDLKALGFFLV